MLNYFLNCSKKLYLVILFSCFWAAVWLRVANPLWNNSLHRKLLRPRKQNKLTCPFKLFWRHLEAAARALKSIDTSMRQWQPSLVSLKHSRSPLSAKCHWPLQSILFPAFFLPLHTNYVRGNASHVTCNVSLGDRFLNDAKLLLRIGCVSIIQAITGSH